MATNRKREEEAVKMGVLLRALLVCAAIAGLGLGYVRQSAQQLEMGKRITDLERRRYELHRHLENLRATEAVLASRPQILERIERFGLALTNASTSQRLYIALPAAPGGEPSAPGVPAGPAARSPRAAMGVLGTGR